MHSSRLLIPGGDSFTDEVPAPDTLLVLDCAASSDTNAICSGIGGIQHTADGKTWKKAIDVGGGQSAERLPMTGKGFGVVSHEAVLISELGDEVFEHRKLTGMDVKTYPGRYGAYPSANVWYVSAGTFPSAPPPAQPPAHTPARHPGRRHSAP